MTSKFRSVVSASACLLTALGYINAAEAKSLYSSQLNNSVQAIKTAQTTALSNHISGFAVVSQTVPANQPAQAPLNAATPPSPGDGNVTENAQLHGPLDSSGTPYTIPSTVQGTTISSPKAYPSMDNTSGQQVKSLKGLADITSVTATATELSRTPLKRMRDPSIVFVKIKLRNDSQQVAVINGDASQASIGSGTAPSVGGKYLVQSAKPGLTKLQVAIVAASSVSLAGLSGPETYELITPGQHSKRSLGEAIGVDGTRHHVEADRFGVRVIMPGDETVGWMAFSCEPEQSIKTVTIPLSFSRSLTPDGVLEVPVRKVTGTETKVAPQSAVANEQARDKAMQGAQESALMSGAPKKVPGHESMMEDQALPPGSSAPPPPVPPAPSPASITFPSTTVTPVPTATPAMPTTPPPGN